MSTSTVVPFDLPSVLVPPEVIELEVLSPESSEDAPIKKEEWPEYMLRLFDNDVGNSSLPSWLANASSGV
jgi:nuclear cap-binding protein subunit 1